VACVCVCVWGGGGGDRVMAREDVKKVQGEQTSLINYKDIYSHFTDLERPM
jgi:hypothetical protein